MTDLESMYKNEFLPVLSRSISDIGFSFRRGSDSFVKNENDGVIGIICRPVYFRPDIVSVEIRCCVSVKQVQDILVEIGFLNLPKKEITWTIGINIGEISNGAYRSWDISLGGEGLTVNQASDLIAGEIKDFGLPYLYKYSKLSHLYNLACDPEAPAKLDFIFPEKQSLVAIILSVILGKEKNVPTIKKYTIEFLTKNQPDNFDVDLFLKYVDAIEKIANK